MNLNSLKNLYYNSPGWIKNIYAKIPFHIRAGQSYKEWNNFLKKEFDSEYQFIKLRETLFLAQNQIPYYKKIYAGMGIPGIELKNNEEFEQIPFITKDVVKEHYNELLNPECKSSFYVTTGGSTGEPMKFIQSKNVWGKEQAFTHSIFNKLDYTPTLLKASFRGAQFSSLPKNVFWHYNPIQNEIQFSPFHLNPETITFYVKEFNRKRPQYIHGYPSAILNFIRLVKFKGLKLDIPIKGVFLISENFEKYDVETIKCFFKCKVLSFYGHSERLIIAPTIDEFAQVYQVDQRYGYFELVNLKGQPIKKTNERGEIIGTSFDNFAMPLIRYKTGDYTSLHSFATATELKINPIEGRWKKEFIEGKNGEELTLTAINFHSNHFDGINSYQFFQKRKGYCELLLTSNFKLTENQIESISDVVNLKIGHAVTLSVRQIDSPILTSRGKQLKLIKAIGD